MEKKSVVVPGEEVYVKCKVLRVEIDEIGRTNYELKPVNFGGDFNKFISNETNIFELKFINIQGELLW